MPRDVGWLWSAAGGSRNRRDTQRSALGVEVVVKRSGRFIHQYDYLHRCCVTNIELLIVCVASEAVCPSRNRGRRIPVVGKETPAARQPTWGSARIATSSPKRLKSPDPSGYQSKALPRCPPHGSAFRPGPFLVITFADDYGRFVPDRFNDVKRAVGEQRCPENHRGTPTHAGSRDGRRSLRWIRPSAVKPSPWCSDALVCDGGKFPPSESAATTSGAAPCTTVHAMVELPGENGPTEASSADIRQARPDTEQPKYRFLLRMTRSPERCDSADSERSFLATDHNHW